MGTLSCTHTTVVLSHFGFRTLLQYKSASLQDCLDDTNQEIRECIELSKRQASDMLFMKRKISSLESEKDSLQSQVQYRDEYLEKHNLTLPYIGSDGELVEAKVRDFADLLKEKEDELEGNFLQLLCYILSIIRRLFLVTDEEFLCEITRVFTAIQELVLPCLG